MLDRVVCRRPETEGSLPGPSRTITVEPVRVPKAPPVAPAVAPERSPDRREPDRGEPAREPARAR
jgi:hypothetical protein